MKFHEITERQIKFFCEHCQNIEDGYLKCDFTTLELVRIRVIKCDRCKKITNEETLVKIYPVDPE